MIDEMSSSSPETVLITGATGGIGSALAEVYAEPGKTLILHGRNAVRLAELAAICESKGARVLTRVLDLRDREELAAWLRKTCVLETVDLVIVNAGVNTNIGPEGAGERWENVQALVEVNVLAAMATVDAVLPSMRARGNGQIALISSLAAYFGLPITPSYCASKAAMKAYGEAMRGWLAPEGVRINVVMPGYVESQMCRDMPGPKPFLWPAEKAALAIKRGLARNQPRISFPFPLNLGTWFLSVLPPAISQRVLVLLKFNGR
jgi:short-subunit dehydrogenase